MKKLLLFFFTAFLLSSTTSLVAQSLNIDSTRFITGNTVATSINGAIPTSDKGILFAGYSAGNPGGIIPYCPYGGENVLIGKIDSNRQISWIKIYGGNDDDGAGPACQTPDGGYAVLAATFSHDGDVTGYKGGGDIWLLRIDGSGTLLWEKCYGSTLQEGASSIANTPDHGFIILGISNGSNDDVPFHYSDMWTFDWLVIKIDSAGNVQWSKDLGGTGDEGQSGSILAIDNNYYIVSSSNSTDHDCTDTFWHPGVNTGGDYYVLKLDDTGKVLWDSSYGGSEGDGIYSAMFDTRDSTIVITGVTGSDDYMVTGHHGVAGSGDMWVVKVNKSGTLLLEKTLGGANDDFGTGICAAHNGGYVIYGSTYPGSIGAQDCWLFLLDDTGGIITNKIFGGTGPDDPYSILPYLNGYAAVGYSGSSVFTEGSCNVNYSGAFVSYIDYWPLTVPEENKSNAHLLVYPNPVQNKVSAIIPGNNAGIITIINSVGQAVYTTEVRQNKQEINTEDWANGLYLIKWESENGAVLTTKLIKN